MDQLFVHVHIISDQLAQTYNLDAATFIIIYLASFIPIYLGAFLILYGSTRNLSWRDIFSLKIKEGLIFGTHAKVGLVLHIFGWAMPYLYIFIMGRNLPFWVYICLVVLFGLSTYLLRKKIESYKYKVSMHNIEIVRREHINDSNEVNELWDIYNKTFEPINEISPCRQSLDKDHFTEALNDLTVHKYILKRKEIGPIGLALVTNDFKNTPWISADYFRVRFPEEYVEKLVFYFMG